MELDDDAAGRPPAPTSRVDVASPHPPAPMEEGAWPYTAEEWADVLTALHADEDEGRTRPPRGFGQDRQARGIVRSTSEQE